MISLFAPNCLVQHKKSTEKNLILMDTSMTKKISLEHRYIEMMQIHMIWAEINAQGPAANQ